MQHYQGVMKKMAVSLSPEGQAQYKFLIGVGDFGFDASAAIGQHFKLVFDNSVFCLSCHALTSESHSQGYCKKCSDTLAKCDICSIKPELCHYSKGTCREPVWGESECLQDHIVYLSYTSDYKVGITRAKNVPARWIDQGALLATPLFSVSERLVAGTVEQAFKELVSDKTQWRDMLRSDACPSDEEFLAKADLLCAEATQAVAQLQLRFGEDAIKRISPDLKRMSYPVLRRPEKIGMPHNLDKVPVLEGTLHGIKGQYLYIGDKVINVRKYGGYLCQAFVG